MRSDTSASCCAVPIELSPPSDQFGTQSVGRYMHNINSIQNQQCTCDMSAWFTFRVYPEVSAHSIPFSWWQMQLCLIHMWLLEQTFDNLNDNTTLAVQVQTFSEERHSLSNSRHQLASIYTVYTVNFPVAKFSNMTFHQKITRSCDFPLPPSLSAVTNMWCGWNMCTHLV